MLKNPNFVEFLKIKLKNCDNFVVVYHSTYYSFSFRQPRVQNSYIVVRISFFIISKSFSLALCFSILISYIFALSMHLSSFLYLFYGYLWCLMLLLPFSFFRMIYFYWFWSFQSNDVFLPDISLYSASEHLNLCIPRFVFVLPLFSRW